MLVFWWTGKGFLTILIVVATIICVGLACDALHIPSYNSMFWAAVFAIAAPINWLVGRRLNAKRRKTFGLLSFSRQLTYRARHRFLSLPMETSSVAMLAFALIAGAQVLAGR